MKLAKYIAYLQEIEPYVGSLLQCIDIKVGTDLPFLGAVTFNEKIKKYEMFLHKDLFNFDTDTINGLLLHESYHIILKHLDKTIYGKHLDNNKLNIAQDLVINQIILDDIPNTINNINSVFYQKKLYSNPKLPSNGVFVEKFGFPKKLTVMEYYDLLSNSKKYKEMLDKQQKAQDEFNKLLKKLNPENNTEIKGMDEHSSKTPTKEELEALQELLKRAKNKTTAGHSLKNGLEIDSIIEDINQIVKKLNYKQILKNAIKKSIPTTNKKYTWSRVSRRYGWLAAGTKNTEKPKLDFYLDCSGSISIDELNQFLKFCEEFRGKSGDQCNLYLFHTKIFSKKQIKRKEKIVLKNQESGGTCLKEVLDTIKKRNADLSIIFTDGHYDNVNIGKTLPPTIFAIRKDGNINHPLKRYGKTYFYE